MSYRYDIFISYRRNELTRKWIEENFVPLIELYVSLEIGRKPDIFIDSQLEIGTTWPIALGNALADSRTIIPLWSKMFFDSLWCSTEVGAMLERESKAGFRSVNNPGGLIFPTIIHDGETMPIELSTIQYLEIRECFSVRMAKDSPKAELLEEKIKTFSPSLANAIDKAPQWQNDWGLNTVNNFVALHHKKIESVQNVVPKYTNQ